MHNILIKCYNLYDRTGERFNDFYVNLLYTKWAFHAHTLSHKIYEITLNIKSYYPEQTKKKNVLLDFNILKKHSYPPITRHTQMMGRGKSSWQLQQ